MLLIPRLVHKLFLPHLDITAYTILASEFIVGHRTPSIGSSCIDEIITSKPFDLSDLSFHPEGSR